LLGAALLRAACLLVAGIFGRLHLLAAGLRCLPLLAAGRFVCGRWPSLFAFAGCRPLCLRPLAFAVCLCWLQAALSAAAGLRRAALYDRALNCRCVGV